MSSEVPERFRAALECPECGSDPAASGCAYCDGGRLSLSREGVEFLVRLDAFGGALADLGAELRASGGSLDDGSFNIDGLRGVALLEHGAMNDAYSLSAQAERGLLHHYLVAGISDDALRQAVAAAGLRWWSVPGTDGLGLGYGGLSGADWRHGPVWLLVRDDINVDEFTLPDDVPMQVYERLLNGHAVDRWTVVWREDIQSVRGQGAAIYEQTHGSPPTWAPAK